jgi:hypothetical protein
MSARSGTSMNLRHRAMQPEDIPECVEVLANHPVIGPRYGPAIEHLPEAWLRLLQCEAGITTVFHADESSRAPICFFGVAAIVRDDFLTEMKTPPHFWMGPELTRRMVAGESPLLTDRQLREANLRGGLNLVCWEGCVHPEYEAHGELQRYIMSVFIHVHRGYLWKEVISSQPDRPDHLDFVLKTGGYLWDPLAGGYTSTLRKGPSETVSQPHVVGTTRDLELKRDSWAGSWVGALFDYHPPVLGFSRSEQRLLSCALSGATDEHLAETLGTSLPAIKKMWVSIYQRVEDCLPELIPDPLRSDLPASGRGREKRRRLLAYLREHPEELRPVSRKLLANAARQMKVLAP